MRATLVDMSTLAHARSTASKADRSVAFSELLQEVEESKHLLQPQQVTLRLKILDKLDVLWVDCDPTDVKSSPDHDFIADAKLLRRELEAANQLLFRAVRRQIAQPGHSGDLDGWLAQIANGSGARKPLPGLSFDLLDEIISDTFQFREPGSAGLLSSGEMTPYQPTPVRHILDLIAKCQFSSDDVFVDLGSGLGHVPILIAVQSGIRTIGVEVQTNHAASARESVQRLNLSRVRIITDDVREVDLSCGTVFYMFTPFVGSMLMDVMEQIRTYSLARQIKICSLGPCTRVLQDQTWLKASGASTTESVSIFSSLSPGSHPAHGSATKVFHQGDVSNGRIIHDPRHTAL